MPCVALRCAALRGCAALRCAALHAPSASAASAASSAASSQQPAGAAAAAAGATVAEAVSSQQQQQQQQQHQQPSASSSSQQQPRRQQQRQQQNPQKSGRGSDEQILGPRPQPPLQPAMSPHATRGCRHAPWRCDASIEGYALHGFGLLVRVGGRVVESVCCTGGPSAGWACTEIRLLSGHFVCCSGYPEQQTTRVSCS